MSHVGWGEEEGGTGATIFELVRVANRDQFVELTMDDKGGAGDFVHATEVVKLLSKKETEEANLVCCDTLDGGVWGHEDESARFKFRGDVGGRAAAERSTQ